MRASRMMLLTLFSIVSLSSVSQAQATERCEAGESHRAQQCTFTSPALSHNQARLVSVQTTLGFAGSVAVACQNGKLQWGEATCAPAEPSDCGIPETTFTSTKGQCRHAAHGIPLKEGVERQALADFGVGSVTYRCVAGELQAFDAECNGDQADVIDTTKIAESNILLSAQSALTPRTETHAFQIEYTRYAGETGDNAMRADALQYCMAFSDYSPTLPPSVQYKAPGKDFGTYYYEIRCPFSAELTCDSDLVIGNTTGSFNPVNKEFTNLPSASQHTRTCTDLGYSDYTKILAVSKSFEYIVDEFTSLLVCGGKASSCSAEPTRISQTTIAPVSCDSAEITVTNWKEPLGNEPTAATMKAWCNNEGFGDFTSKLAQTQVERVGNQVWYDTTVSCSSYSGGTPLLPSCDVNAAGSSISGLFIERLDCDTAHISSAVAAEQNPLTGEPTSVIAQETFEDMCKFGNYALFDEEISRELDDEAGNPLIYYATVKCSGFKGDKSNCNASDPCLGNEVPFGTQKPHRCMPDGKCYENLCADVPITDPSFCADCAGALGQFTDLNTGNTCNIVAPNMPSGATKTFPFANSQFNGEATMDCNNGEVVAASGTCYRTCPGGVNLSWNDAQGAPSCSQTVPNGIHKQGDVITFGSSLTNTGNASYTCNNGNWIPRSGGSCLRDCGGEITWGSGLSGAGVNKAGLCKATLPVVKHGVSGTSNSTTLNTVGSVTQSCNDGTFDLSNPTCNTGCSAQSVSWGNQCRADLAGTTHNQTVPVSHGNNPSYPFASTISGNASFMCSDGVVSLQAGSSCRYVQSQRNGTWDAWSDVNGFYGCGAWSPTPDTVNLGTTFEQTRICKQDQERGRVIYNVWNDGSETVDRNELGQQTVDRTDRQNATGTRNYVTGTADGPWTAWTNQGLPSCGAWGAATSTVDWGVTFTQSQACNQDQTRQRSVFTTWADGSQTFLRTEVGTQTISYTNSRSATGTRDYVVNQTTEPSGSWSNTGAAYGCSAWGPSPSTFNWGVSFTQSRSCEQMQTRPTVTYNNWASGTRTVASTGIENQSVGITETRSAVGANNYVAGETAGPWSSYSDTGAPSCGAWSPQEGTVTWGQAFTQSASCSQDQQRSRIIYTVYADGSQVFNRTEYGYQTVNYTATRGSVGTGNAPLSQRTGDWSAWENVGAATCGEAYPLPSTVNLGDGFTQTRDCTQPQSRSRIIYTVWADGSESFGYQEWGYQDLFFYSYNPAVGTRDYLVSVSEENSPVRDVGSLYSCSTWTPSAADYFTTQQVAQSRNCTQGTAITVTEYNNYASGVRTVRSTRTLTGTRTVAQTQTVSGTKPPVTSGFWKVEGFSSPCYFDVVENDYDYSMLGQTCPRVGEQVDMPSVGRPTCNVRDFEPVNFVRYVCRN